MKKYNLKTKALILIITACLLMVGASIAAAEPKASEKLVNYVMGQEYGIPVEPGIWRLDINDETRPATRYFKVMPKDNYIVTQNGKSLLYLSVLGDPYDKDGNGFDDMALNEGDMMGLRYYVYDVTDAKRPQLLAKGPEIKDGKVVGNNDYHPVFSFGSFEFTRLGANLWGWIGVNSKYVDGNMVGNFDVIAYMDNKFVNLSRVPAVLVEHDNVILEFHTVVNQDDESLEYFHLVTVVEIYNPETNQVWHDEAQTTEIKHEGDEVYYPNNLKKDWPAYLEMNENKG